MQTYTFDTVIRDGIIPVPKEYMGIPTGAVRVTIQKEETTQLDPKQLSKKKTYNAIELDITDFKFNREEANARR